MYYSVEAPDGTKVLPIAPAGYESRWVCSASTYASLVKEGMIEWRMIERDGVARWQVYQKHYLGDGLKQPSNLWNDEEGNKKATRDLNSMFEGLKVFDHPKPIGLLQKIVTLATSPEDHHIVMDFFAGSGTTAHAVLAQNILDGGNRRYILVQIPEPLDSNNRAQQVAVQVCQKLGLPPTVAELTKERIRRASTILKRELPPIGGQAPDLGFRVLKIDSSNMKDVYYVPDHVEQRDLLLQVSNVKPERTPEDLLFQILVDWGVDLGLPISEETIGGRSVFFVDRNALAACFDLHVTEEFIKEIAKRNPLRVVFRDGSFGDDSAKINAEQIFKLLSPSTEIRSI